MTPATIIPERLARIRRLDHGAHNPPNGEFAACAMEAVAYIAGEPWSDHPACACPVLTVFMVSWNDALPDDERTALLLPLIPRLVGTRGSKALEARRATMAADWYVRVFTPAWLRLGGLNEHADTLAGFPEITSFERSPSILLALEAAYKAASAAATSATAETAAVWGADGAARSAAESAARTAARSAARSAAESAARTAAWRAAASTTWTAAERIAARSAASAASSAWRAAASAARNAAWRAAMSALNETKIALQTSAVDLVGRMIDARDDEQEPA